MAPIPEDNRGRQPNEDASEIDMFSNPNLSVMPGTSDSSDENDEDFSNVPNTTGYTLLSQDPCEGEEEADDSECEDEQTSTTGDLARNTGSAVNCDSHGSTQISDISAENVIQSEDGASARTVSVSSSTCHPAFLAKFPDGKVPSYMQVPSLHSDSKDDHLWNQRRLEKSAITMDAGQESKILKAMAGFSLPKEHVPDWARNLSDDQWKNHVLQTISPEEKQTTWHNEMNSRAKNDENKQQETTSSKTEANCDWVATFPDS